ncbi:DUF4158 domain-containing protein, partial [Vibrio vulnificus]|nr:DUF4158 domain-containing protein [Vibrio vulnificus]MCU8172894.1 DUF4158 domain-containing protein [Vibrio vulnificus]
MARLTILTDEEIRSLYQLPDFDDEERAYLFAPDDEDLAYLERLGSHIPIKINYLLQLGYFRAIGIFFQFNFRQRREDVEHIISTYFPDRHIPSKALSKQQHYKNRAQLIKRFSLTEMNADTERQLEKVAKSFAQRHSLPKFVLQGVLEYCQNQRIIRPSYSKLQTLVSQVLQ